MLYLSLVPAALLLLAAHVAARPHPKPLRWELFVVCALGVTFLPIIVGLALTAPVMLAVLLGAALAAWYRTRERVRWFLPYSLTAVLLAYGLATWWAWRDYSRVLALRDRHPFETLADRMPEPRREAGGGHPADDTLLGDFEVGVDLEQRNSWRASEFFRLHEQTTSAFVNSPGFGVARMRRAPTEESLKGWSDRLDTIPPQPESPGPPWQPDDFSRSVTGGQRSDFERMHVNGVIDFVNPRGWGYVRSRREVAGFLPHAFSRVPEAWPEAREWKVVRVELVGLLRHPEPVAYPSDRLPAMADLAAGTAPTRPLDAFEAAGLEAIRRGEDGFAGRRGDEVRYVGAVRSAAACVNCHGGERGDLLGAFAYRLRPAGR